MLNNYLKITFRTIRNHKTFSLINIMGLTLGITCSLLIYLWVQDEYSIDNFHNKIDRLYIVNSQEYMEGEVVGSYDTPGLLGEELPKVIPEIELACNYAGYQWLTLSTPDKIIKQPCKYAGKDFFKMFSYKLIEGTTETALSQKEDIAISEKIAANLFGNSHDAIGKTVLFENYLPLKVTAVFEDIGSKSSEKFGFILNWDLNLEREPYLKEWHNSGPKTFVLLKPNASQDIVNTKIKKFIASYDKEFKENDRLELSLQPYGENYLNSQFKNGKISGGRIEYVRLFSILALFILFIACINFMNLSTAGSLQRAKEIGVRKVIGAKRSSLIYQFLGEAFIYSLSAVLLSLLLLIPLIHPFNQVTDKQIHIPFGQIDFKFGLLALILITTIMAGSYPALLLSSFRPIAVLKNNLKLSPSSLWTRKGLVIFQFVLSILFISSMIIINQQVDFIQNKNLGYEKKNLIYLPLDGKLRYQFEAFKNEALKISGIQSVSRMTARPIELENTTGEVDWEGKVPNSTPRFTQLAVGYDFVKTMKSTLISGRDFSPAFSDSTSFLINEKALEVLKYSDPLGKPLTFWGIKGQIVGVIQDFHFESLHKPIAPLIIRIMGKRGGYALIRTDAGMMPAILIALEKLHKKMNPEFVFAHQFADEEYSAMYQSEQLVRKLSMYFTLLAILISCMGLLGLVIFSAQRRLKEISIRKVMGASAASLFTMLTNDFMKLIVLAFIIAIPLTWYLMNSWLNSFAYRINIGWQVFALAGTFSLLTALLTISYQAIRSARINPMVSIKTE